MTPKLEKSKRATAKSGASLTKVCNSPKDDPIWEDEDFWAKKWPAMVDRHLDDLEAESTEWHKYMEKEYGKVSN